MCEAREVSQFGRTVSRYALTAALMVSLSGCYRYQITGVEATATVPQGVCVPVDIEDTTKKDGSGIILPTDVDGMHAAYYFFVVYEVVEVEENTFDIEAIIFTEEAGRDLGKPPVYAVADDFHACPDRETAEKQAKEFAEELREDGFEVEVVELGEYEDYHWRVVPPAPVLPPDDIA